MNTSSFKPIEGRINYLDNIHGETRSTEVPKAGGNRKAVGSNIGLRRRHPHALNRSANTMLNELLISEEDESSKSTAQTNGKLPAGRRPLLHQTNRSQISARGHERLPSKKSENAPVPPYSRWEVRSHRFSKAGSQTRDSDGATTDGSSDTESPYTILANPELNVMPVAKSHQTMASFDFYVNSYVISIIEVSPQDVKNYTNVVHQILHDEMLFTAFTTCSEAAKCRTQSLYADPPLSVVAGYGKTISLLSNRLQSGRFAMTPAVLLTMGQLVAIETLTKNVSATARHLAGMQTIMAAKTGDKSAQESSPVQNAVAVWTKYFMYRRNLKSSINSNNPLTYPRHPFDPKISNQIAELPVGFADVALSERISVEMLDLLHKFSGYFTSINRMIQDSNEDQTNKMHIILLQAAHCIEYCQIQALTLTERLILAALTAYVVRRDRIHPALVNMRNYYQITCAYISNLINQTGQPLQKAPGELHTWIGLILLLTSTPEAYARKLALKLLPDRPEPMNILKQCQKFFWDEDLTNALLSGTVLSTETSNDIIADNVKQSLPGEEGEPDG